jgi:hypothetical protein
MARIEARTYNLLYRLGATAVEEVLTPGGGAANPVWTSIRSTARQGLPVHPSPHGRSPPVWPPCSPLLYVLRGVSGAGVEVDTLGCYKQCAASTPDAQPDACDASCDCRLLWAACPNCASSASNQLVGADLQWLCWWCCALQQAVNRPLSSLGEPLKLLESVPSKCVLHAPKTKLTCPDIGQHCCVASQLVAHCEQQACTFKHAISKMCKDVTAPIYTLVR